MSDPFRREGPPGPFWLATVAVALLFPLTVTVASSVATSALASVQAGSREPLRVFISVDMEGTGGMDSR